LAWLPLSLAAFRDGQPSAIFVIFITSVWPIIINTAVGFETFPQDYRNVAAVVQLNPLEFSEDHDPVAAPLHLHRPAHRHRTVLARHRAAEMLIGGVGIGFSSSGMPGIPPISAKSFWRCFTSALSGSSSTA